MALNSKWNLFFIAYKIKLEKHYLRHEKRIISIMLNDCQNGFKNDYAQSLV